MWKKKGYLFIVHVEEGIFIVCSCGIRAFCLLPMWKKGYLFFAHVRGGICIYCPCTRRRDICLLPMKKKGYLLIALLEEKCSLSIAHVEEGPIAVTHIKTGVGGSHTCFLSM